MPLGLDDATRRMRHALCAFLERSVRPAEPVYREQLARQDDPWHWTAPPVVARLQEEAKELGLWNLFLPGDEGAGLTRLQSAELAEVVGRSPLGPVATNCSAPDTGTMAMLSAYGTPEQKERWLEPLLDGRTRSALVRADGTSIVRDGDEYVLDGRATRVPGALNPDAKVFVVEGRTDPTGGPRRRLSHVIVPRHTPGLTVDRQAGVVLDHVRVPVANILGAEGDGLAISRACLGPDRLHHCRRLIGAAEEALGREGTAVDARERLDRARLLVLEAAWLIDAGT